MVLIGKKKLVDFKDRENRIAEWRGMKNNLYMHESGLPDFTNRLAG